MKAYREILFLTSVLVEREWPTSCPTSFIPRREPQYPFSRFGGPQTQSGWLREEKSLSFQKRFKPQNAQPLASINVPLLMRVQNMKNKKEMYLCLSLSDFGQHISYYRLFKLEGQFPLRFLNCSVDRWVCYKMVDHQLRCGWVQRLADTKQITLQAWTLYIPLDLRFFTTAFMKIMVFYDMM
jgi:hypothetical protein